MAKTKAKKESGKPMISIRFIFTMCNDIVAMRHIYSELIGLEEISFKDDEEWGWLSYKCDGFQLMIFRAEEELPIREDWSWQPGYGGGPMEATSWSIEVPEEDYPEIVKRIQSDEVKKYSDKPEWRQDSYWGFSILDPMGNTIEIYTEPKEEPASTEWPEK
jgi:hypothetical protein